MPRYALVDESKERKTFTIDDGDLDDRIHSDLTPEFALRSDLGAILSPSQCLSLFLYLVLSSR